MLDPDLKTHLESIEKEIVKLHEGNKLPSNFLRGIVYGAGYIIGAVLIITVIGWILNIAGVIPALSNQVSEFRTALQRIGGPIK